MSDEKSKKLFKELQQANIKIKPQPDLRKIASRLNKICRTAINPFTGEKVPLEPLPETMPDRYVDFIEAIKEIHKKPRKLKGETIKTHQNYLQLKQDGLTTQQAFHGVLLDVMYAADVRAEIGRNAQKAQSGKRNVKPKPFTLLLMRILRENPSYSWRNVLDKLETFTKDTELGDYIRGNDKYFVNEIISVAKVSPKKPLNQLTTVEQIKWKNQDNQRGYTLIRNLPTLISRARPKKIKS